VSIPSPSGLSGAPASLRAGGAGSGPDSRPSPLARCESFGGESADEERIGVWVWDEDAAEMVPASASLSSLSTAIADRVSHAMAKQGALRWYRHIALFSGLLLALVPVAVRAWYTGMHMQALIKSGSSACEDAAGAAMCAGLLPRSPDESRLHGPQLQPQPVALPLPSFETAAALMAADPAMALSRLVLAAGHLVQLALGVGLLNAAAVVAAMLATFIVGASMFMAIAHAEEAFHARYLAAKYFAALSSGRRSRRFHLPLLRMNNIESVRMWLTLRSFLKVRISLKVVRY
jgi:hypothetical protein